MRDTQIVLLQDGGAEVVDVESEETIWASDSDEEFAEEFPELLDQNDVEHLQDYLEERGILTSRELETCDIVVETLEGDGPCDDDDDDDDDGDVEWDEDDTIEGEGIDHADL